MVGLLNRRVEELVVIAQSAVLVSQTIFGDWIGNQKKKKKQ